jgi:hypothetical protein
VQFSALRITPDGHQSTTRSTPSLSFLAQSFVRNVSAQLAISIDMWRRTCFGPELSRAHYASECFLSGSHQLSIDGLRSAFPEWECTTPIGNAHDLTSLVPIYIANLMGTMTAVQCNQLRIRASDLSAASRTGKHSADEVRPLPGEIGLSKQSNHTSPKDSTYHRSLRSALRKLAGDDEVLRDIFWLLNASDHLYDVRRLASNLLGLLPLVRGISEESSLAEIWEALFSNWEPVLRLIVNSLPTDICPEQNAVTNPYRGDAFLRNPLWANLWEQVCVPGYRWLVSHFVFAHVRYLYTGGNEDWRLGRTAYERYGGDTRWKALPQLTYDAALKIRQLADSPWIPVHEGRLDRRPPREFLTAFSSFDRPASDNNDSGSWQDDRGTIRTFLARANGFESWPERNPLDESEFPGRNLVTIASDEATPGDPDDPDTRGWPDGSIVSIAAPMSEEILEEAIDSGIDPEELADKTEYYLAAPAGSTELQQLAIQREIQVRGQYRHLQMQHQLLPFAYDIPSAQEVKHLLERLDEATIMLRGVRERDEANRRAAEIVGLIQIQLWLGVSLGRARSLVVIEKCESDEDAACTVAEGTLIYSRLDKEWIVPIDSPPYRREYLDPEKQAHPHLRWLPLPDIGGVGRYAEALRSIALKSDLHPRTGSAHHIALFPADQDEYEQGLREFLRESEATRRITVRRLGLFLFNRLVAHSGDLMAGALITGRMGTLTRTERFYASYSVSFLRQLYVDRTSRMLQLTTSQAPQIQPLRNPSGWQGHVGARLCAKDQAVKQSITDLKDAIGQARDVAGDLVEFHNLLTTYTVMYFCFSTSCRPIRTPYIGKHRIDEETGFAYLCDKDDDAHHKARLIWVPGLCREQMSHYEDHCKYLADEYPSIRDWPEPCFFLKKDFEPVIVRPTRLATELKPFLGLPLNFYRSYLRHRLLEANTSPEAVMTWLGHAFAGEEFWNTHSAMSATGYRDCIAEKLPDILKELGWTVLT